MSQNQNKDDSFQGEQPNGKQITHRGKDPAPVLDTKNSEENPLRQKLLRYGDQALDVLKSAMSGKLVDEELREAKEEFFDPKDVLSYVGIRVTSKIKAASEFLQKIPGLEKKPGGTVHIHFGNIPRPKVQPVIIESRPSSSALKAEDYQRIETKGSGSSAPLPQR